MPRTPSSLHTLDKLTQSAIVNDQKYISFFTPFLGGQTEAKQFLSKCLKKISTRRMMLRVVWYADIADNMPKVKEARPALQIAFLISMAEQIARRRYPLSQENSLGSQNLVLDFFKHIETADKNVLVNNIRRLLGPSPTSRLRLSSIIRIFYDIRNKVFHGQDFWSFSLKTPRSQYNIITSGYLGKGTRKRRISLDVSLTYNELRGIMIRTAIRNIKLLF